eukprot:CAMPEP_0178391128 /NCGR_PEP_ID=MMETSP0689_2-20121128/11004_1 /TAXON_ID=160604 /ORGANISM="Amphidinium massartii, Strain CS-259" /LENGTH=535 /DNA_ID=CAMNT_0020011663 /DNA_START=17 /DNA_END=1620 /DNA_ORIENTATION=-
MGCQSSTALSPDVPSQACKQAPSPLDPFEVDAAKKARLSNALHRYREHPVLSFVSSAKVHHEGGRSFSVGSYTDFPHEEVGHAKAVATLGDEILPTKDGVGFACLKGHKGRESPNQDSFCLVKLEGEFSIYGVFDGHGRQGHDISDFAKEHLPKLLLEQDALKDDPPAALRQAFVQMQDLIIEATDQGVINASNSGTTASLIYHDHQRNLLHVANVGDSRCILGQFDNASLRWDAVELTTDHKLTVPQEYSRIQKAGGLIMKDAAGWNYRVYASGCKGPGLNMSRALGDLVGFYHCGLTPYPDVRSHSVQDDVLEQRRLSSKSTSSTSTSSTAPPCNTSLETFSVPDLDDECMTEDASPFSIDSALPSPPAPAAALPDFIPPACDNTGRFRTESDVSGITLPLNTRAGVSDSFVVMCSDGVWDYITSMDAVAIVSEFEPQEAMAAADHLTALAKARWTCEMQGEFMDDITAVVVFLGANNTCSHTTVNNLNDVVKETAVCTAGQESQGQHPRDPRSVPLSWRTAQTNGSVATSAV